MRRKSPPAEVSPPREAVVRVSVQGGPFEGVSRAVVQRRAHKMLRALALPAVELSIALVDDAAIQALNRSYRKKDKPTDVLSFAQKDDPSTLRDGDLLGDVILSIPTTARQAREQKRPLLDELTMLLAHGMLHLVGYDHRTAAEDRVMRAKTDELTLAAKRPERR
jgi:probable rRNA maturation factor